MLQALIELLDTELLEGEREKEGKGGGYGGGRGEIYSREAEGERGLRLKQKKAYMCHAHA